MGIIIVMDDFDVIVVGSGPGGYVAAIRAAQAGRRVALVEKADLGGICLNWGCIPTKALLRSAEVYSLIKRADRFGITVTGAAPDWPAIVKRSRDAAFRLSKGINYLMQKNKIEVIAGTGTLVAADSVEVTMAAGLAPRRLFASAIILSTGARPRTLPGLELDGRTIITSKEAMNLPQAPRSVAIIGGGAIGVEFAYFFREFGAEVSIIEMLPHLLPLEDEEISTELEKSFTRQGIKVMTGRRFVSVLKEPGGVKIALEGQKETVSADMVLVAIGTQGNTEGIGLEKAGVTVEKGFIKVDGFCRTNVKGVYAIGDCIGAPLLAHAASREGFIAVEHILGRQVAPVDNQNMPACTYCQPQVASVGLTQKAAESAGRKVKVGRFPYRANGKAIALGETEGLVKLVIDEEYGEVLGCHIIGTEATEMIGEIILARGMEATCKELIKAVHPHPTLSEMIGEVAAQALGEAVHV